MSSSAYERSLIVPGFLGAVLGAGLLIAGGARAQRPSEPARFADSTTVSVVEVPVRVLVKGQPIRGLTADNFVLLDRGKRRTITSFEVVDLGLGAIDEAAAEAQSSSSAGQRKFLFLFDLVFTHPRDVAKAEAAARELVRHGMAPSDLVAIGYFSGGRGLDVVLNFTSDRNKTLEVLDGLAFLLGGDVEQPESSAASGKRDPLRLSTAGWNATLADIGSILTGELSIAEEALIAAQQDGSLGAFLQRNILANMSLFGRRDVESQQGTTVVRLADQFGELAQQTATVPGQKHLVFFSSGFEGTLLNSEVFVRFVSSGSGTWVLSQVDAGMEELRRAGWSVHPVVPGGTDASPGKRAGLFHLAAATGGTLLENRNELSRGLEKLQTETSVIYVLTFEASDLPAKRTYRPLRVKLENGPKGAQVFHRDGYFAAATVTAEAADIARWQMGSLLAGASEIDQLGVGTLALPIDLSGPEARVAFLVDVPGDGLLGPKKKDAEAEFYVYAFDLEGRVWDFLATRVAFDLSKQRRRLLAGGVQFVGDLRLRPGRYRLRCGVRSPLNGRLSVITREIVVPRSGGERHEPLSPMLIADDADRGVVVWKSSRGTAENQDEAYPFTLGDLRLAPSARPTVRPPRRARVALMGFDLVGRPLMARLVAHHASGLPVSLSEVAVIEGADGRPDLRLLDLETTGLSAGTYWLEMKVGNPAEAEEIPTARVVFRVPS